MRTFIAGLIIGTAFGAGAVALTRPAEEEIGARLTRECRSIVMVSSDSKPGDLDWDIRLSSCIEQRGRGMR